VSLLGRLMFDFRFGRLRKEDVRRFLLEEAKAIGLELTKDELDHVTRCCYAIYEWYRDDRPLGHFLSAVVSNDLMGAVGNADKTNRRCLVLYVKLL